MSENLGRRKFLGSAAAAGIEVGALRSQNDDVSKDTEGLATARGMGRHLAEVALKMAGVARSG